MVVMAAMAADLAKQLRRDPSPFFLLLGFSHLDARAHLPTCNHVSQIVLSYLVKEASVRPWILFFFFFGVTAPAKLIVLHA